jgi:serine/threonine protein kinase
MTRERWERLAPLVDAVLDRPPEQRIAYVAEVSGGDAALAEELTRFVDASDSQQNQTPAASIFAAANDERSALMSERLRDSAFNLQTQLEASLGASYVIEREIGGGGMARVFAAEESGLGRKVVIKVLPPEMSGGMSAERFAREIKLAASLQQANIVPVLTAGTAAGFPYYTMPFVEGRSLRERLLREGPLPVNEAISILRDVARALAFAHSRGVIHRDIKPGNILLSDRTAVVTDFGIAKALGVAREQIHAGGMHDSLSQTGTIGTPAYMAPEQASGDPSLDHRADIYSFGCMAYELLTGKPPFVGATPHHIIASHLRETPRRLTELRPEVPIAVAQLVASCLEKAPSRRPQTADDVLRALDAAANEPTTRPRWRLNRKTLAISSVIVFAGVAVALAYYALRSNELGTSNGPAADLYRIGQVQLRQRSIAKAVQTFQRAIARDSNFARAHAGLATALSFAPAFLEEPTIPLIDSSVAEARRALALDGALASLFRRSTASDAYVVLGKAHGYAGEWAASDSDILHAIKLKKDNSQARQTLARHLMLRGYAAEAIEEFERARAVDSTSATTAVWLAYAFFLEGRRDSAGAEIERANELDTTLLAAANLGALLNLGLGRKDSALRLASIPVGPAMPNAPYVFAKLGHTARANLLIHDMETRNPRPWYVDVAKAGVYLATNDTANALAALKRSADSTGALWVFYIPLGDPAYDPVRKSERFAELLHRANIDLRVVTSPRRELSRQ